MKLFFRKYLLIMIYVLLIYFLLFLFKNKDIVFLNIHLFICMLLGLLIRLFDDYLDYEKDINNNKCIFNKKTLLIMIIIFYCILSIIFIISKTYLYFILLGLLLLNLIRYRLIGYIKSIYIPLIIIFVSHYCFGFNLFYIIMIFLFLIGDLCLIYKKR